MGRVGLAPDPLHFRLVQGHLHSQSEIITEPVDWSKCGKWDGIGSNSIILDLFGFFFSFAHVNKEYDACVSLALCVKKARNGELEKTIMRQNDHTGCFIDLTMK